MKKYEVIVEDENSDKLSALLQSLPYVKEVKESSLVDIYSAASEESLSEDWLSEDDDELQRLYSK
jgi:hypothetical protein